MDFTDVQFWVEGAQPPDGSDGKQPLVSEAQTARLEVSASGRSPRQNPKSLASSSPVRILPRVAKLILPKPSPLPYGLTAAQATIRIVE